MQKEIKVRAKTCTIVDVLEPEEYNKTNFLNYLEDNFTKKSLCEIIWSLEKFRKEGGKRETQKVGDVMYLPSNKITALETGEIIIGEEDYTYNLPESEVRFESLVKNDIVEDLTVKQVHQLVKLLVLTEAFKEQGRTYNLFFEANYVNKIFEKLT